MQQVRLSQAVTTIGIEPDPAKRLRKDWGDRLKDSMALRDISRKELRAGLIERGHQVSVQAIGQWCRGETMPKIEHQRAVAAILEQPVRQLFPVEAAA